jgi:hypothetical protein
VEILLLIVELKVEVVQEVTELLDMDQHHYKEQHKVYQFRNIMQ